MDRACGQPTGERLAATTRLGGFGVSFARTRDLNPNQGSGLPRPRSRGGPGRSGAHARRTSPPTLQGARERVAWLAGNAKTDPELRLRYRQALEVDGGSQRGDARMLWESIRPVAA